MDEEKKLPEETEVKATPVPEAQLDTRTRAQIKKELHERKQKERAEKSEEMKNLYHKIKDEPALADILAKGKSFAAYHMKLAKDGVGFKVRGQDENGKDIVEDYVLTSEQRIAELDQCKGLEQLVGYIEQKLA